MKISVMCRGTAVGVQTLPFWQKVPIFVKKTKLYFYAI